MKSHLAENVLLILAIQSMAMAALFLVFTDNARITNSWLLAAFVLLLLARLAEFRRNR